MTINDTVLPPLVENERIFDSHAHYDDAAFDADRDLLLNDMHEYGVCGIVNNASDIVSARKGLEIAHKYPFIYQAVGIHPECAASVSDSDLNELERLLGDEKAVAVGEIGLDYHYEDGAPKETQQKLFCRQIELAQRLNKPIIVHDRDAHGDTFGILARYKPDGVVHCYSGSVELMREILKLGMYIGVGGVVTFKNARKTVECVNELPLDRLLVETDAPYLSPVPFRGKRCCSSMIAYTADIIAQIKGITRLEVLKASRNNANRLFGTRL